MNTDGMLRPWLRAAGPAMAHLVMCPFAGASGGAFRSWRELDEPGLDVSLVIYPGHGHRLRKPCEERIENIAGQLADELGALSPDCRENLLLAGHSMGAQVAFETCVLLERIGMPPAGLVLSGCHAPHLQGRRLLSQLDDRAFLEQLIEMGGCGPELLADPDLLAPFLPLLRADFRATENYRRALGELLPLRTPALLLYGSADQEAWREEVLAWRSWLHEVGDPLAAPGDHFYVTRRPRAFLKCVVQRFEPILIPHS